MHTFSSDSKLADFQRVRRKIARGGAYVAIRQQGLELKVITANYGKIDWGSNRKSTYFHPILNRLDTEYSHRSDAKIV